jgi:hypothetical protein
MHTKISESFKKLIFNLKDHEKIKSPAVYYSTNNYSP